MKKLLLVSLLFGWNLMGQLPPLDDAPKIKPLLEDTFSTDRAAGSVHLTAADGRTPSQIRRVMDTESKLSISGGKLVFAGGKSTPLTGDPGIWYPSQARVVGKTLMGSFKRDNSTGSGPYIGWDVDQNPGILSGNYLSIVSSGTAIQTYESTALTLFTASPNVEYSVAFSLRTSGDFIFLKDNTLWKLVHVSLFNNTSTLYPSAFNSSTVGATVDNVRVPKKLFTPSPNASDSFNRTTLGSTDGAGHAEANGGAGLAWQTGANNTWLISAGKLVNNPTMGNELVANGDFASDTGWTKQAGWTISGGTANANGNSIGIYQGKGFVGNWIRASWDVTQLTSGGFSLINPVWTGGISGYGNGKVEITRQNSTDVGLQTRSGLTIGSVDNFSVLPLFPKDLFCTVNCGTPDVLLDVAINGTSLGSSGTQAGVVLNLDSPTDPKNFVIVYFDGTGNIRAEKCINGNYTSAFSTPVTYGAGKVLRVMHDKEIGEYRVFYDNVLINSAPILSFTDDAYKTKTYHGVFSTSGNASFSGFTVWNRYGYEALDYLK